MTEEEKGVHSWPFPPLEPAADERPTPENTAFAEECVAGLQDIPMIKDWILGKQLVTRSDTWGVSLAG